MSLRASIFLALRYLRPKRAFISIIMMVSVLGPILGVGVLIVTISIMKGFEIEIKRLILGFEPHVVIMNNSGLDSEFVEYDWQEITDNLRKEAEVIDVSYFVSEQCIVEAMGSDGIVRRVAPSLRSIPSIDIDYQFLQLKEMLRKFGGDPDKINFDENQAVISAQLAAGLRIGVGDKITLISSKNVEEVISAVRAGEDSEGKLNTSEVSARLSELISPIELIIAGIFDQPRYDNYVFTPLHIGQELFELGGDAHGAAIYLQNPYRAGEILPKILQRLPASMRGEVATWMNRHAREFAAIRNERAMMFLVLFVILVVSAFCIMNTLLTVTVQKIGEIGIIKALGARSWQIINIFVMQGMLVGVIGTFLGLIGGLLFLHNRNEIRDMLANIGVDLFPPDIYGLSSIPAKVMPYDLMMICIGSILLCVAAALAPAYFVSRLDAAKALRNV